MLPEASLWKASPSLPQSRMERPARELPTLGWQTLGGYSYKSGPVFLADLRPLGAHGGPREPRERPRLEK